MMFLILGLGLEMSKFESYDLNQKRIEKERQQEKLFKDVDDEFTSEIISVLEKNKLEPSKDYFKHEYRIGNSGKYIFLKQPTTVEAIICNKELRDSICSEDVEGTIPLSSVCLLEVLLQTFFEQITGCKVGLVLDRTQLCSTESNRESDSGTLLIENEIVFDIEKVVKRKGFIAHFGTFKKFPKYVNESLRKTSTEYDFGSNKCYIMSFAFAETQRWPLTI